jgi:hypothetical protein
LVVLNGSLPDLTVAIADIQACQLDQGLHRGAEL